MVSKSYMLEKKPPPSGLRRIIDQGVFPVAIDTAASVEMMLERVSVRTREQPVLALGTAFTTAFAASLAVRYLLRPRFA